MLSGIFNGRRGGQPHAAEVAQQAGGEDAGELATTQFRRKLWVVSGHAGHFPAAQWHRRKRPMPWPPKLSAVPAGVSEPLRMARGASARRPRPGGTLYALGRRMLVAWEFPFAGELESMLERYADVPPDAAAADEYAMHVSPAGTRSSAAEGTAMASDLSRHYGRFPADVAHASRSHALSAYAFRASSRRFGGVHHRPLRPSGRPRGAAARRPRRGVPSGGPGDVPGEPREVGPHAGGTLRRFPGPRATCPPFTDSRPPHLARPHSAPAAPAPPSRPPT